MPADKDPASFHGGKSFEAIGEHFDDLGRADIIINADVLDAWFDPSPRVIEKLRYFLPFLLRTSPPVYAAGLSSAIACSRGIPEDSILIGGGSSHLIFTCLPRLCYGLRRALILDPMYGEYRHILSNVMEVETITFDLHAKEEFRIETDRLIQAVLVGKPDLVVLVNPNSPTGIHWPRAELIRFLQAVPLSTNVLVDETYVEYVGRSESVETECGKYPNLLVMKSMSKVFALSGVRVGYVVANPHVARTLAKWLAPWSVSLPAQVAAVEALADMPYYERQYKETHRLREELAGDLRRQPGVRVYPSQTNYLFVEVEASVQNIVDRVRRHNVFIRNCDSMSSRAQDRFIRVTVKKAAENKQIVEALLEAISLA